MTTLDGVLSTIQTAVGSVSGVKYAPDDPPEQPQDFPFVVTYPMRYRGQVNTPEDFRMLYDIAVELHVARRNLPTAVQTLLGFPETIANAIFSTLITNLYAHDHIEGGFGALRWGDIETLGFTWTIVGVKITTTMT